MPEDFSIGLDFVVEWGMLLRFLCSPSAPRTSFEQTKPPASKPKPKPNHLSQPAHTTTRRSSNGSDQVLVLRQER